MNKRIAADNVRPERAYESPAADGGTRVLIDQPWPRGVEKTVAQTASPVA
jgi:uncharacterized protein YeaO (DUF488 family)